MTQERLAALWQEVVEGWDYLMAMDDEDCYHVLASLAYWEFPYYCQRVRVGWEYEFAGEFMRRYRANDGFTRTYLRAVE